jgi:hypothetical protein
MRFSIQFHFISSFQYIHYFTVFRLIINHRITKCYLFPGASTILHCLNLRCKNLFSLRENHGLLLARERRMQRQHQIFPVPLAELLVHRQLLVQRRDLCYPRQKDQNGAALGVVVVPAHDPHQHRLDQLVVDRLRIHQEDVLARLDAALLVPTQQLRELEILVLEPVVRGRNARHAEQIHLVLDEVGVVDPATALRAVLQDVAGLLEDRLEEVLLDGEGPAGDGQHGDLAEVVGEELGVHGGAHHDHLQVGAQREDLPQDEEQEVALFAALVHFVHDDVGNLGRQQ